MTTVVSATDLLRLRPLKIVELNAATTASVRLYTGSAGCRVEVSAGSLDLGLLRVVLELEYSVTASPEHAVCSACTFAIIEYYVIFICIAIGFE